MADKQAGYAIAEAPGGFTVRNNGMVLTTPRKAPLALPSRALAEAVMEEAARPVRERALSSIAATAIDIIAPDRVPMTEGLLAYAETDTLCFLAENGELRALQEERWHPVVGWAQRRYDCRIDVTEGLSLAQPDATMHRLRSVLDSLSHMEMAAFSVLTQAYGSFLLALSVWEGEKSADEAFTLSRLEEEFQNARWGVDDEALRRAQALRAEALAAERFLSLLPDR